mmetsp:Transcript_52517/g.152655  ORF Transcript_52517/g.152655 Transcript_52517/m.152655 type:complete len:225 (+) Transcript_52517:574-1248(+)
MVHAAGLPGKLNLQLLHAQAVEGPSLVWLLPEHPWQHHEQLLVKAVIPAKLPEGCQSLLATGSSNSGVLQWLIALLLNSFKLPLPGFTPLNFSLCASLCSPRGLNCRLLLLNRFGRVRHDSLLVSYRLLEIAELGFSSGLCSSTCLLFNLGPLHDRLRLASLRLQCLLHAPHCFAQDGRACLLADVHLSFSRQAAAQAPEQQLQAGRQLANSLELDDDCLALFC